MILSFGKAYFPMNELHPIKSMEKYLSDLTVCVIGGSSRIVDLYIYKKSSPVFFSLFVFLYLFPSTGKPFKKHITAFLMFRTYGL